MSTGPQAVGISHTLSRFDTMEIFLTILESKNQLTHNATKFQKILTLNPSSPFNELPNTARHAIIKNIS